MHTVVIKKITLTIAVVGIVFITPVFGTVKGVTAQSPTTYDVVLLKQQPVYTYRDARYGIWLHNVKSAFSGISVISDPASGDNRFVVAGYCTLPGGPPGAPSSELVYMKDADFGSGGMYLLDNNGNEIGRADVCYQAALKPSICKHNTGCHAGARMLPIGGTKFVRVLSVDWVNPTRSPITYSALSSGFQKSGQIYFNDYDGNFSGGKRNIREGDIKDDAYVAYANGVLVTTQYLYDPQEVLQVSDGSTVTQGGWFDAVNAFYTPTSMTYIGEDSTVIPFNPVPGAFSGKRITRAIKEPKYLPVVGVGEYFVARKKNPSGIVSALEVYRMPTASEISSGSLPQLVHELPVEVFLGYSIDSFDNNRIALFYRDTSGVRVRIYKPGSSGLTLEKDYRNRDMKFGNAFSPVFEGDVGVIAGPYLAYASPRGDLVVEKNGISMVTQPLPRRLNTSSVTGDDKVWATNLIAIAPNGKMLVAAASNVVEDRFNATKTPNFFYLYQINELTSNPIVTNVPPVNVPSIPSIVVSPPAFTGTINDYFQALNVYIESVRLRFLGGKTTSPSSGGAIAPERDTKAEIDELLEGLLEKRNAENTKTTPEPGTTEGGTAPSGIATPVAEPLPVNSSRLATRLIQEILNLDTETQVSVSGPGSPGNETDFLGLLTVSALKRFQCKYAIVCGGTPLTTGYGNPGPLTVAKLIEVARNREL